MPEAQEDAHDSRAIEGAAEGLCPESNAFSLLQIFVGEEAGNELQICADLVPEPQSQAEAD